MQLFFIEDMRNPKFNVGMTMVDILAKYLEAHKVNSTERERILIRAEKL